MKISEAGNLLEVLLQTGIETGEYVTARLLSSPGIGKSTIVKDVAKRMSKKLGVKVGCKVVRLLDVEQPDVKGYGLPPESRSLTAVWDKIARGETLTGEEIRAGRMQFSLPSWAWDVERDGEYGFMFLDEQPQSSDDVNKVAAEIMLDRRVGEYQLPPGVIVVAAGNREQDRSGARKTMAFIQNRIVDIEIDPDKESLVHWMEENGIHHTIISYTEAFAADLLSGKVPEKSGPFCTPRSLCRLSPYIDRMSVSMLTEFAAGMIGEGSAAKFIAHLRVVDELPTYQQIVDNPKKTKVPSAERPDAIYAVVRMIAFNVTKDTAMAAFTYLGRLPEEFQATALRHAVKRTPQIVQHPEFASWLRQNKKLVEAANIVDKK